MNYCEKTLILIIIAFSLLTLGSTQVLALEEGDIETFTTCGEERGYTGPSQTDCNNEYEDTPLEGEVNIIGDGIQEWTVNDDGIYRFRAAGAKGADGGASSQREGYGAEIEAEIFLEEGETIRMAVGQKGVPEASFDGNAGGGGTFLVVEDPDSTYEMFDGMNVKPLIIAGGGGGDWDGSPPDTNFGREDRWDEYQEEFSFEGGWDWGDGGSGEGAGGGFLSDGECDEGSRGCTAGGQSFLNGALGGESTSATGGDGGFGGGGAYGSFNYGSGGGGASGGDFCPYGDSDCDAGGGSYITDDDDRLVEEIQRTEDENPDTGSLEMEVIEYETGVSTLEPDNITSEEATLRAEADEEVDEAWFEYKKVGEQDWEETTKQTTTEEGEYTEKITELEPLEEYEYRAVGEVDGEQVEDQTVNFVTADWSIEKPDNLQDQSWVNSATEADNIDEFPLQVAVIGGEGPTFTNCGNEGPSGPSQTDCNNEYEDTPLEGEVNIIGDGIQEWTVNQGGTYQIRAEGARGGSDDGRNHAGYGAIIQGQYNLEQGDTIRVLVGQGGDDYDNPEDYGSGGGGTFVTKVDESGEEMFDGTNVKPLIIAGGGGGIDADFSPPGDRHEEVDGLTATWGGENYDGGNGGEDGDAGDTYDGGGGGGFLTGGSQTNQGDSFLDGGLGKGSIDGSCSSAGGFGGGGSASCEPGAAGGYSGGAGADSTRVAGGGGSFIHASILNTPSTSDGNWQTTGTEPQNVYDGSANNLEEYNDIGHGEVELAYLDDVDNSATRISPGYDLDIEEAENSHISWEANEPDDSEVNIYTAITDGTQPEDGDWVQATNGDPIPEIQAEDDLQQKTLWFKQELLPNSDPELQSMEASIEENKFDAEPPEVTLEQPQEGDETLSNPTDFEFTPTCNSDEGCEEATLLLNREGEPLEEKTTITDVQDGETNTISFDLEQELQEKEEQGEFEWNIEIEQSDTQTNTAEETNQLIIINDGFQKVQQNIEGDTEGLFNREVIVEGDTTPQILPTVTEIWGATVNPIGIIFGQTGQEDEFSEEKFIIEDCPAEPFCINYDQHDQPHEFEDFDAGDTADYSWEVEATDGGFYRVFTIANSTRIGVEEVHSNNEIVEVIETQVYEEDSILPAQVQIIGDDIRRVTEGFGSNTIINTGIQINSFFTQDIIEPLDLITHTFRELELDRNIIQAPEIQILQSEETHLEEELIQNLETELTQQETQDIFRDTIHTVQADSLQEETQDILQDQTQAAEADNEIELQLSTERDAELITDIITQAGLETQIMQEIQQNTEAEIIQTQQAYTEEETSQIIETILTQEDTSITLENVGVLTELDTSPSDEHALEFFGNEHVETEYQYEGGAVTFNTWMKARDTTRPMVGQFNDGSRLYIGIDGDYSIRYAYGEEYVDYSIDELEEDSAYDQWIMITMTVDEDDNVRGYYQGEQVAEYTEGFGGNPENLWLGDITGSASSHELDGLQDDVRIYDKALSEDEVQKLYDQRYRNDVAPEHLEAWWPLNEGEGETVTDQSSNDNDGQIFGAEWVILQEGEMVAADFERDEDTISQTVAQGLDQIGVPIDRQTQEVDSQTEGFHTFDAEEEALQDTNIDAVAELVDLTLNRQHLQSVEIILDQEEVPTIPFVQAQIDPITGINIDREIVTDEEQLTQSITQNSIEIMLSGTQTEILNPETEQQTQLETVLTRNPVQIAHTTLDIDIETIIERQEQVIPETSTETDIQALPQFEETTVTETHIEAIEDIPLTTQFVDIQPEIIEQAETEIEIEREEQVITQTATETIVTPNWNENIVDIVDIIDNEIVEIGAAQNLTQNIEIDTEMEIIGVELQRLAFNPVVSTVDMATEYTGTRLNTQITNIEVAGDTNLDIDETFNQNAEVNVNGEFLVNRIVNPTTIVETDTYTERLISIERTQEEKPQIIQEMNRVIEASERGEQTTLFISQNDTIKDTFFDGTTLEESLFDDDRRHDFLPEYEIVNNPATDVDFSEENATISTTTDEQVIGSHSLNWESPMNEFEEDYYEGFGVRTEFDEFERNRRYTIYARMSQWSQTRMFAAWSTTPEGHNRTNFQQQTYWETDRDQIGWMFSGNNMYLHEAEDHSRIEHDADGDVTTNTWYRFEFWADEDDNLHLEAYNLENELVDEVSIEDAEIPEINYFRLEATTGSTNPDIYWDGIDFGEELDRETTTGMSRNHVRGVILRQNISVEDTGEGFAGRAFDFLTEPVTEDESDFQLTRIEDAEQDVVAIEETETKQIQGKQADNKTEIIDVSDVDVVELDIHGADGRKGVFSNGDVGEGGSGARLDTEINVRDIDELEITLGGTPDQEAELDHLVIHGAEEQVIHTLEQSDDDDIHRDRTGGLGGGDSRIKADGETIFRIHAGGGGGATGLADANQVFGYPGAGGATGGATGDAETHPTSDPTIVETGFTTGDQEDTGGDGGDVDTSTGTAFDGGNGTAEVIQEGVDNSGVGITDTTVEDGGAETVNSSATITKKRLYTTENLQGQETGQEQPDVSVDVIDRTINIARTATQNTVTDTVSEEIFLPVLDLFQTINIFTDQDDRVSPQINEVTVDRTQHGHPDNAQTEIIVNVTDLDGNEEREEIRFDGFSKEIETTDDIIKLELEDTIEAEDTIEVEESSGLIGTHELHFKITDNNWQQSQDQITIEDQIIEREDTIENTGNEEFNYNISHTLFEEELEDIGQEGQSSGTLQPSQTSTINTQIEGNFLKDEIGDWTQDHRQQSTTGLQFISKSLELENIPEMTFNNVEIPSVENPEGFGECDDCEGETISTFTAGLERPHYWVDTGDIINREAQGTVEDFEIGTRENYYEQYMYNKTEDSVELTEILAVEQIEDNRTDHGGFITVAEHPEQEFDNQNGIAEPIQTPTCDTNDPQLDEFTFNNQTWETCTKDLTGNERPDYFKMYLPKVETEPAQKIRIGGFLGIPPEREVEPYAGLIDPECEDGETFGDLECYREQWRASENVERQEIIVDQDLTEFAQSLGILLMLLMIMGYLGYRTWIREDNQ